MAPFSFYSVFCAVDRGFVFYRWPIQAMKSNMFQPFFWYAFSSSCISQTKEAYHDWVLLMRHTLLSLLISNHVPISPVLICFLRVAKEDKYDLSFYICRAFFVFSLMCRRVEVELVTSVPFCANCTNRIGPCLSFDILGVRPKYLFSCEQTFWVRGLSLEDGPSRGRNRQLDSNPILKGRFFRKK